MIKDLYLVDTSTGKINLNDIKSYNKIRAIENKFWEEPKQLEQLNSTAGIQNFKLIDPKKKEIYLKRAFTKSLDGSSSPEAIEEISIIQDLIDLQNGIQFSSPIQINVQEDSVREIIYCLGYASLSDLGEYYNERKIKWTLDELLAILIAIFKTINALRSKKIYFADLNADDIWINREGIIRLSTANLKRIHEKIEVDLTSLKGTLHPELQQAISEGQSTQFVEPYLHTLYKLPIIFANLVSGEENILGSDQNISDYLNLTLKDHHLMIMSLKEILDKVDWIMMGPIEKNLADLTLGQNLFHFRSFFTYKIYRKLKAEQRLKFIYEIEDMIDLTDRDWIENELLAIGKKDDKISLTTKSILIDILGTSLKKSDEHEAEVNAFFRSLTLKTHIYGTESIEVAESQIRIANMLLYDHQNYSEAINHYNKALEIYLKTFGGEKPNLEIAKVDEKLGLAYHRAGEQEDSVKSFQESIKLKEEILGTKHRDVASVVASLGAVYYDMKKYVEAIHTWQKSLENRLEILPEYYPEVIMNYYYLGSAYFSSNNSIDARINYGKFLNLYRTIANEEESVTVAMAYTNIGIMFFREEEYEDALRTLIEGLKIKIKLLGANNVQCTINMTKIAAIYILEEKYQEAATLLQKSFDIQIVAYGNTNIETAITSDLLGQAYFHLQQYDDAQLYYFQAIEIHFRISKGNSPEMGDCFSNLAALYFVQGKFEDALKYYFLAYEIHKVYNGEHGDKTISSCFNIGLTYGALGKHQEAIKEFGLAVDLKIKGDVEDLELVSIYDNLSAAYQNLHQYSKALHSAEESVKIRKKLLDLEDLDERTDVSVARIEELKKKIEEEKLKKAKIEGAINKIDNTMGGVFSSVSAGYYLLSMALGKDES